MGFGACYPERSDPRHAPVIILQENRRWDNHIKCIVYQGPAVVVPKIGIRTALKQDSNNFE
jgi:hypothetical protein